MNYPDLSNEKLLGLDIETYDPELKDKGPGVYRKDGTVLGISIATKSGFSEYYNICHKGINSELKKKNLSYLKDILGYKIEKIGANILYDLDWIENYLGIKVNGKIHDIQYVEPLLDEYGKYSLDTLAKKYLGIGKSKSEIEQFCKDCGLTGDFRQHLYAVPFNMVREYAIKDAEQPLKIYEKQMRIIHSQDLTSLYEMEINLIPLLLLMRKTGVKISLLQTMKIKSVLERELYIKQKDFDQQYGDINFNSSKQLSEVFDRLSINYPYTEKGNPSINQHFMKSNRNKYKICGEIVDLKKLSRVISATFQNVLISAHVNQRIHTTFTPLRKDDHGTVSGRFSSYTPNLQQIPSKRENFGDEVRGCFIPELNHIWAKLDYSQIEYRVLAHYAEGERSDEVRMRYKEDPNTDYHSMIMEWTGLSRKETKSLNFGCMYAMGIRTCADTFGWSLEDSELFIKRYHKKAPYVKTTMDNVIKVSKSRGYIKTILNRRARVSAKIRENGKEFIMFNRLIQGSAADIMKKGMVDAYNKGLFSILRPHLTVHDELDVSVPITKEGNEALNELKHTMESCVKLRVPIKVDVEIGPSWGKVKGIDLNKDSIC